MLLLFVSLVFPFFSYSQLKVSSTGNLGVGNNAPAYKFDLEGTARFSAWTDAYVNWTGLCASAVIFPERDWYLQLGKPERKLGNIFAYKVNTTFLDVNSDAEIKTNIAAIDGSLEIVKSLNGRTYNFVENYYDSLPESVQERFQETQYGFIAEEVQDVLPGLVVTDSGTTNSSINYISIIPILVEAIKEQQQLIVEMQDQLGACCGGLLKTGVPGVQLSKPSDRAQLFQNAPNPFSEKTEIKCIIPSGGLNPVLIVSNLNGVQLRKYDINGTGNQSVTINGGDLVAGSYYYTLIIDNKEVATRKMILIK